jgi:hydrogenase maturation protease
MSAPGSYWEELERPGPDAICVAGQELRAGSRVRLRPASRGDIFDIALAGQTAVVESVEQDMEGNVSLAVVIEEDPGRDLGAARQPGHRFFFSPAEVEPVAEPMPTPEVPARRVLVAGIGNVFLGDDAFGVVLADRLARRELPSGVEVIDYGIRGMDLAYAMQENYDAVVLLDAAPRGGQPGSLYVIEPQLDEEEVALDTHGMDPAKVLALVRALGTQPPRTLVLGCEPQTVRGGDEEDLVVALSEPVRAALDPAVKLAESLLSELTTTEQEVDR